MDLFWSTDVWVLYNISGVCIKYHYGLYCNSLVDLATCSSPEQLHGTKWCEKDAAGEYVWDLELVARSWRAKMLPGWRLIIGDYPLVFSENWHTFSGCVDANYRIDNGQIGSFFTYDEPIDPAFNYYNVETVLAVKKGFTIPKGSVTFSMIPYYDPDYQAPKFDGFPKFNS